MGLKLRKTMATDRTLTKEEQIDRIKAQEERFANARLAPLRKPTTVRGISID
jgi:hypothetical protein